MAPTQPLNIDYILKYVAEYIRTSTGKQDLRLQQGTNEEYLKVYPKDRIYPFIDQDVSANKISMVDRPALNRMIKMIEQGKIDIVVVYERDRLARNVYEYIEIVSLFYKKNIEVIFTASKAAPFSRDLFVETWYGLSAQFEGEKIATRSSDGMKRNPAQLIGYKKIKGKKDSSRKYTAIKELKAPICNLFTDFSNASNKEEVYNIVFQYKDLLDRTDVRVIEILNNPFFTGHYVNNAGAYIHLPYVDEIVPLDIFKKVQEKLEIFGQEINEGFKGRERTSLLPPLCAVCKKKLVFKKGEMGRSGRYSCSKHKNHIDVSELNDWTNESLKQSLEQLSFEELEKVTVKAIKKKIADFRKQSSEIETNLVKACKEFTQQFNPQQEAIPQQKTKQEKIFSMQNQLSEIKEKITEFEQLATDIDSIRALAEYSVNDLMQAEYETLVQLLISNISVHKDYVHFEYYFSEFLKEDEHNVS